jgi:hypothetical protein
VGGFLNQVQELDDKVIDIDALGDNQTEVKGCLKPAAQEDQARKGVL